VSGAPTHKADFTYSASEELDACGRVKRTVTFDSVFSEAVEMRDLFEMARAAQLGIDPVPGFRRVPGDVVISEDRTRLTVTVHDFEAGPSRIPEG
jgi:hypothetical protein